MLENYQIDQLRKVAESLTEARAWDQLPWDDAWAGKYPKQRTEQQVNAELRILIAKVERIMRTGRIEEEYSSIQEQQRMIHLENCTAISLFGERSTME